MKYVYTNITRKRANEIEPGDYLYFAETDTQFAGHMRVESTLQTKKNKIIVNKDSYSGSGFNRKHLEIKCEFDQWVDVCKAEPEGGMNKKVAEYIQVSIYDRELKPVPPPTKPNPKEYPIYTVQNLINELQTLNPDKKIVYRNYCGEEFNADFKCIFSKETDEVSNQEYLVVDFSE